METEQPIAGGETQEVLTFNAGAAAPPANAPEVPQADAVKVERTPSPWNGIGRLACFFCLLLGLIACLHAMITGGLRRITTSDFGVWNRIVSGTINADVIVSGSSRAMSHYDSAAIENATGLTTFNLGLNGSQTDMQVARLKTYLKYNKKPSLVIHNLDLFSFATSKEIYDPAQYVPYLDEEHIYGRIKGIYPHAWKWKYLPLYGYTVEDMRFSWFMGLLGLAGWEPAEDHFNGYVPRYTAWTGDFDKYREANPNGVRLEIESQGIRDLEELVRTCAQNSVRLLFVYSPEYAEMQKLERNRTAVFAKFADICHRFDIPMWDYSSSPISERRDNFYNSQHLNAYGASAFSIDLGRRLKSEGIGENLRPRGTPSGRHSAPSERALTGVNQL